MNGLEVSLHSLTPAVRFCRFGLRAFVEEETDWIAFEQHANNQSFAN
jgi:hypothetical protein